ncbi:MAG: FecR domain-containing protein [Chloroflexi bacterium]|nr:FecR domain-containing protein [Chloroflexota bacterium]
MMASASDATTIPAAIVGTAGAANRARRRAWICLWLAFVVWCAIALSGLITAANYRRSATDAPASLLLVDRGTVFHEPPGMVSQVRARPSMPVEEGSTIEVGDNGLASVELFDGSTIALLANSRLELTNVRVGKYNADHTRVILGLLDGAAQLNVAGKLPYGREIVLNTPYGQVSLSKGEYLVWVQDDGTKISSYVGRAKAGTDETAVRLRDGQRAILPSNGVPRGPFILSDNLIRNGDFSRQLQGWTMLDKSEPGRPDVGGTRRLIDETIAGRHVQALSIARDTAKDTHNETGITQEINRDVSAYRNVWFTAWVKINHASLSGGGYLGSEYPLMFRVSYTDEKGGRPGWSHGFFYANPENRPSDNGEQIAQAEWYPFLGRLSDLPDRPVFIRSIEVLSAGHDFDADVADIRLIAE